ncbi:ATP-binding protein [Flavobacterium sp. DG1-102-2]|uniref:ATP-binding protein n=1 Tax=Flavobacterium sp. DG1-102-2 TaxID=3081663 RepID=UPI002948CBFB|nr:ATP-binding protein [Flavobacterium sp. DG1-102-2]MDV6169706.1 ATP-binding protein [Flavobacterium sp. DG1-102-2]
MQIKDIVNRDIVNLTNCEQEPIHIPGSIQPHGFLIGLKENSFIIDYCSANTLEYIGISHTSLLGKSMQDVFGSTATTCLQEYIANEQMLSSSLLKLTLEGKDYLCTVHNSSNIYILEAEPVNTDNKKVSDVYNQTSQFLLYMHDTHTLKQLCQLVANGVREITGYDRVMVYRFDKDYNGEVFAEAVRDDLEPFLGLHYPHTDIPPQARELYMKNLLRLITDIDYTPVPLYTVDDTQDKNLDLSLSILRSTSPIHVQYLHNMGVGATLTISLIYKKKLWGLIACHHYSPKNLTPEIRLAAQLQGHFITSQIDLRQATEEYDVARKTNEELKKLDTFILTGKESGTFKDLLKTDGLLELCNAAGAAIVYGGAVYSHGITPTEDEIQDLANWLATHTNNGSFHTDKLLDYLPNRLEMCGQTSGLIYHSLDTESNNCIIWFRPETKTEVNWAGDPNKAIVKDKNGLYPRNSFKLWKEIVSCTSKPWIQPEITTAASYANSLQRQINLLIISEEEEKYRKLSELLKETNSELQNINWISTHDLQEPLRKIQIISSRILSKEKDISENVQDSINRMNHSAGRMQTLLADILKYTKLRNTDGAFEPVDVNKLIEELRDEMAETLNEKGTVIYDEELPKVKGVPFLLKQLLSNLIANSIKYAASDRSPEIKITASPVPMTYNGVDNEFYNVIHVTDNGIGFEPQFAESIFNIFTKLHASSEYKGSGVGLALCKKIMQNHKGYITAVSEFGKSTTISMYFPVNNE